MMASRLELQNELEKILGSEEVHFQPPSSVSLRYPCIVYELDNTYTAPADNKKYIRFNRYTITHIYKSITNSLKDVILDSFQLISHDDERIIDGLYHDYFTLYY